MLTEASPADLKRTIHFDAKLLKTVEDIVEDVRKNKESAVRKYTKKFDATEAKSFSLFVEREEIERQTQFPKQDILDALLNAKRNIEDFHKNEKQHSFYSTENPDCFLAQSVVPLDRVALYVPGGRAFYPSTLLMTAIPALTAGVKELTIFTPPDKAGNVREEILYLANILGISRIVKAGGAQAVALAAFGSTSFVPVDKIVGPGNDYVTLAKKYVFGYCDIDMLAGPSEIMIIADTSGKPEYIARDLLSQAEHDENAHAVFVTNSRRLLAKVNECVAQYTEASKRKAIIKKSLSKNGKAIVVDSINAAFDIANSFGPEHLEVVTNLPDSEVISRIKNAGSVFIGEYASEPVGDYMAGSNHVLPTYGSTRFSSPLGVYDFYRKVNFISVNRKYLTRYGNDIVRLAEYEGLFAHANAVSERLKKR